jgi:hypothetical protein
MIFLIHIQNFAYCDVLIFSNFMEQYFKHLHSFFYVAKQNSLVVLKSKISLFQTRFFFLVITFFKELSHLLRNLLHLLVSSLIKILNKIQLQSFLESHNYGLDFYHNMSRIAKLLYDRLRKNHVQWSDEHTRIVW